MRGKPQITPIPRMIAGKRAHRWDENVGGGKLSAMLSRSAKSAQFPVFQIRDLGLPERFTYGNAQTPNHLTPVVL